jgi:hypothetical protein
MAVWSEEGRTTREPDAPACLPVLSSRAVAVRAGRCRPAAVSTLTNRARIAAERLDASALRSSSTVIEAANRL